MLLYVKTNELKISESIHHSERESLVLKPGEQIHTPLPCVMDDFEITAIAGHRRLHAAKQAGLEYIPIRIQVVRFQKEGFVKARE